MVKSTIIASATSTTGYALQEVLDNNETIVTDITKTVTDKEGLIWYILPENHQNRKCISGNKMAIGLEVTYRETRVLSSRTSAPKGSSNDKKTESLKEYMSEEDKKTFEEILERAKKAMDDYYNNPRVKLLLEAERAKKAYQAILEKINKYDQENKEETAEENK